jgi:hypothetical protein
MTVSERIANEIKVFSYGLGRIQAIRMLVGKFHDAEKEVFDFGFSTRDMPSAQVEELMNELSQSTDVGEEQREQIQKTMYKGAVEMLKELEDHSGGTVAVQDFTINPN